VKTNEQESGGSFLVGYRGRLFEIQSDYQVAETTYGFAATGCGEDYLLGAMHALAAEKPEQRILRALAAAEEFSAGVRGPFIVKSI
jgi:ATP-dependent protease HslVU (ClpYQ) peptidase subunit